MFLLNKLLAALILPPAGPVLLALFGLWLASRGNSREETKRWRRTGLWLASASLLGLLVLSLPVIGSALMAPLEVHAPITSAQLKRVQAIVILGGGAYANAPEYGGATVGGASLERLRYGARLARESGLPVLVTGGSPFGGRPEGELMREALETDFGVKVRWVEAASRNTLENASQSGPLLKAAGITRIALVTHALHLPRAIPLFERQGLEVVPAPMAFSAGSSSRLDDLLPSGLGSSRWALHEYLGRLYNRLKE